MTSVRSGMKINIEPSAAPGVVESHTLPMKAGFAGSFVGAACVAAAGAGCSRPQDASRTNRERRSACFMETHQHRTMPKKIARMRRWRHTRGEELALARYGSVILAKAGIHLFRISRASDGPPPARG